MKKLTEAEEEIMQLLWEKEKAFVKDLIALMPDPKPAYNTVSTIVRILEKKGFVSHESFGKSHRYYPLIRREDYARLHYKQFMKNYFGNSFQRMVSFFAREEKLSIEELEEILQNIDSRKP